MSQGNLFEYAAELPVKSAQQNWRNSDPSTSRDAGISIQSDLSDQHREILSAMRRIGHPAAAQEVADELGWESHVPVNRRFSELVEAQAIERTDEKYRNKSGRGAYRYRLTGKVAKTGGL